LPELFAALLEKDGCKNGISCSILAFVLPGNKESSWPVRNGNRLFGKELWQSSTRKALPFMPKNGQLYALIQANLFGEVHKSHNTCQSSVDRC